MVMSSLPHIANMVSRPLQDTNLGETLLPRSDAAPQPYWLRDWQQGFGGFTKVYEYVANDAVKRMHCVANVIRPRSKDQSACLCFTLMSKVPPRKLWGRWKSVRHLVDTTNGSESITQWASGRQTSMATSAPEAEVTAMAEGHATSFFLFDTLEKIKVIKGFGPTCLMSLKTNSNVALKQFNTHAVTVRTRTAALKLAYLRELTYQEREIKPLYIPGPSQRADAQTKIVSGQAFHNIVTPVMGQSEY